MNTLLQRQLRKYHGDSAAIPPEWQPFLAAVEQAYDDADADRKMLERSLDLSSAELGKANSRLNEHASRLEAANNELEAFSYSVSHDLRAPLRHIDGFVDLLSKHAAGKLDERECYYLQIIADSAVRMGRLIDDLLRFSRMSRVEMHRVNIDMASLANDVIKHDLELETKDRRIEWKIGPLPEIEADSSLVRQVWVNLIGNAVKYSRTRDPAVIEIGCTEADGEEEVYFIRDNGVGFDMQYADKLFGVFQRLHRAEEFEGTGIGLANVRRIISRQGGHTWAAAKKDLGATFFFSLPRNSKDWSKVT